MCTLPYCVQLALTSRRVSGECLLILSFNTLSGSCTCSSADIHAHYRCALHHLCDSSTLPKLGGMMHCEDV